MSDVDGSGGVSVEPDGKVARGIMRLLAVLVGLTGPVVIILGLLLADGEGLWISLVAGGVLTVVTVPLGISMWMAQTHEHEQTLRLRERGVPASAEVLQITPTSYGEESRMTLTLRVTGPGITTFQATHSCAFDSSLSVGDRLGAVVDPSTNGYAIPNRR
ncbi:hypothetical protein HF576_03985 [Microbacterium sp. CFH 90308]|uniref:Uncharacterized protein n=1 Tax=Microbacterium salsuginis TaxID=2722803 RepID=A0ABX1K9H3_9MICO|nr:hypothetical protein [Microbacterium sp. CFH 90308]NLP82998.1 hypothetical protein [Microbacterium sp. CFH 90308]